jgi:hypothetical protein
MLAHAQLPLFELDRGVTVLQPQSCEEVDAVLSGPHFLGCQAVGLDCEWVGAAPVALLQLASPTCCLLVRRSFCSTGLAALLCNEAVVKAGVGVVQDAKR